MTRKKYNIEEESIPIVSEPMPAYGSLSTPQPQAVHPTSPFVPTDDSNESFVMDVDPELGARRAAWGRDNFDRLLAEAEKLYGYEKGNDFTIEQYFGILRYTVEKCYEAVPED